jgi:hypothetical protein
MPIGTRTLSPFALVAALAAVLLACSGGGGGAGAPPSIAPSVGALSFTAVEAGANPAAQSLTVSNGGGGELAVPTTAITYAAGVDWLSATVSGGSAPFTVTVQPLVGALPPGTYSASVFVRSNGASNTPQSVAVTLVVTGKVIGPSIGLSRTSVSFTTRSHGPDPVAEEVVATNGGGGTLSRPTLQLGYEGSASGWLSATVGGDAAAYTISLRPSLAELGAGTYRATVTVESAGASNTPTISVTLTLTPTWTVLVYASADNALSTSLMSALAEMSEATLNENVTVLVAADWSAGRTLPGGEPFQSGTEWYLVAGRGAAPELLTRWEEQNLDDPAALAAVVEGAFYAYPADRHAVVLWGPGAGWEGFGGDENDTPGDPSDDGTPLSAAAIAQALADVLPPIGVQLPLDVLGFDAPLMMGQEVAFAFRDVAATFVASAELDLGPGWSWTETLTRLSADPYMSPAAFAAAEVDAWDAHHAGPADLLARAHAALDLTKLPAYASAWSTLSTAMLTAGPDWLAVARDQFAAAPGYGLDGTAGPGAQPVLRDAGQLLDALAARTGDAAVTDAAAEARLALDALVLGNALGDARRARSQAGVNLEAPLGSRLASRAPGYGAVEWAVATGWASVLESLALNDDGAEPSFEHVAENASEPSLQNPPSIHVRSYDADVAAARLSVADVATGTSYGVIAEETLAPNVSTVLVWDGNLAALQDATISSFVFLRTWLTLPSGAVWLVPGEISDGVGSVDAHAVVVDGEPVVDTVAVRVNGATVFLALADFRGLDFIPTLRDALSGAPVAGPALAIPDSPTASLVFRRTSAPAGTYQLTTTAVDVWGRSSSAADQVIVTQPFGS